MTNKNTFLTHLKATAGFLSVTSCVLLMVSSVASAATVTSYSDAATFLSNLQSGYLEDFNGMTAGTQNGPVSFSLAGFHYSADAPGDSIYFIESPTTAGDFALSTMSVDFNIVFTFSPGINAVGGSFFPTDAPGDLSPGVIVVALNDGTTQTLTDPSGTAFSGFISNSADISSLTVSTGGTGIYATVDNFYTGASASLAAAPEPGSVFLLLGGLTACSLELRRRKLFCGRLK